VGEILFDIACKALNPNGFGVLQAATTYYTRGIINENINY